MKSSALFLIFLVLLTSCDQPRSRKDAYTSDNFKFNGSDGDGSGDDDDKGNGGLATEFSHCGTKTYTHSSPYLADYMLCKSSQDETKFYFRMSQSGGTIWLIPMYKSSSTSLYIGNPVSNYITPGATGSQYRLYKNRTGFESYTLNAVMILKDEKITFGYPYTGVWDNVQAFLQCMHTAHLTDAYCQAYVAQKRYELHTL